MYTIIHPDSGPVVDINNEDATIKGTFEESEIVGFANTFYYYQMLDEGCQEFTDFEGAKLALETDGFEIRKV